MDKDKMRLYQSVVKLKILIVHFKYLQSKISLKEGLNLLNDRFLLFLPVASSKS